MENENWEADWEVEQNEDEDDMHPAIRMSGTDYKLALIRLQEKK
tara:strand:- start:163 stop:294 length:132 start_codon:yes stop_codon:yes gene_type:complete